MLRDHIVHYIISNMLEIKKSNFLLKEKFECTNLNSDEVMARLWAIEGKIGTEKFSTLLCEITNEKSIQEYILLSNLDGSPFYASYLCIEDDIPTQSALSYSMKDDIWLPTNVYLQATYLAGMESLKDVLVEWNSITDASTLLSNLESFYNATMESEDPDEEIIEGDIL